MRAQLREGALVIDLTDEERELAIQHARAVEALLREYRAAVESNEIDPEEDDAVEFVRKTWPELPQPNAHMRLVLERDARKLDEILKNVPLERRLDVSLELIRETLLELPAGELNISSTIGEALVAACTEPDSDKE